jgi:hypothetical protein
MEPYEPLALILLVSSLTLSELECVINPNLAPKIDVNGSRSWEGHHAALSLGVVTAVISVGCVHNLFTAVTTSSQVLL